MNKRSNLLCLTVGLSMMNYPASARAFANFSGKTTGEIFNIVNRTLRREIEEAYLPNETRDIEIWRVSLGKLFPQAIVVWLQNSAACGASSNSACPIYILVQRNQQWLKGNKEPFGSNDLAAENTTIKGVRVLTNWRRAEGPHYCAHVLWTGSRFKEGRYGHLSYCKGGPR